MNVKKDKGADLGTLCFVSENKYEAELAAKVAAREAYLNEYKGLIFLARNIVTGEARRFTFNDLYGYEGEVTGVLIDFGDDVWQLSYNSGYGRDGMNPELEISLYQNGIDPRDVERSMIILAERAAVTINPDQYSGLTKRQAAKKAIDDLSKAGVNMTLGIAGELRKAKNASQCVETAANILAEHRREKT